MEGKGTKGLGRAFHRSQAFRPHSSTGGGGGRGGRNDGIVVMSNALSRACRDSRVSRSVFSIVVSRFAFTMSSRGARAAVSSRVRAPVHVVD